MNQRHTFGQVFTLEVRIAVVVFALVALTVVFALARSASRRGKVASQTSSHPRAEMIYLAVVAALAVFLVGVSISANSSTAAPRPSLRVMVTGFQWCWRFSYENTPVSVTGQCVNGDIPTLELPTGRVVQIDVTSDDVVHSMWVPYLRFKMQAFPNHVNSFDTTLHATGRFPGRCAEFCGLYHYAMDFTLDAVPPAQFDAWLHAQETTAK